jgi:macrolide-specific efflux system membrane fusion protein
MRRVVVIAGLVFTGLAAIGYAPVRSLLRRPEQADLPLLRVARDTLTESTVAVGTIKSKVGAEVKVGSQLSGVVAKLKVNVGDEVAKGDVLALLQDEEWRARVDVLKAQLASAIAEREYAESQLEKNLRLRDLVPAIQIEDIRRNLKVKQAAVAQTRASLADAEIQLGYTVIRAPVAGTIASVSTYQGETVAASLAAPTFLTIVDLHRLEVQAYVDETDIGKVHVGQHVTFRVDAYRGDELEGVVQAIYPKAQLVNNVVDYVVIVDIVNPRRLLLRPEMTVHVNLILAQRAGVVSVPRNALLRQGGRSFVVVRSAGQWLERPVETGLQTPQRVEIVSGLAPGETILAEKQAWKSQAEKSHD